MLKIKNVTIKNFMSVGNVTETINLDGNDVILVLGENLDQGGLDSRNGVGKTVILNAISFGLYGWPIASIKKDNLINNINQKNMYVTVDFDKDGTSYRIERGRKPAVFKFIVNNTEQKMEDIDDTQGDSRTTQREIENAIGVSYELFKQIMGLNTVSEPFLGMRVSDQKIIIEQLLGITKLSEKSEQLKKLISQSKDELKEEEYRIKAINDANDIISDRIRSLETKSKNWESNHNKVLLDTEAKIEELLQIDINNEISMHEELAKNKENDTLLSTCKRELTTLQKNIKNITDNIVKIDGNLDTLMSKSCPMCEQAIHNDTHETLVSDLETQMNVLAEQYSKMVDDEETLKLKISKIPVSSPVKTYYSTINEAYNHKSTLETLCAKLENEMDSVNPFNDEIQHMKTNDIQVVDMSVINELNSKKEHQEFLFKLLTNKDSFIRKKIIQQNINYLNNRLSYYLETIGLPHEVKFVSDLSVEITQFGRDMDFDNLSRGEKTRLILSMSWAMRDVYESLNGLINFMFIDELLDSGLDTAGVNASVKIIKRMSKELNRNVFLVSHREELQGRIDKIFRVIKDNGFTTFSESEA